MSMIVFYIVFSMSFYAETQYESTKHRQQQIKREIGIGD